MIDCFYRMIQKEMLVPRDLELNLSPILLLDKNVAHQLRLLTLKSRRDVVNVQSDLG